MKQSWPMRMAAFLVLPAACLLAIVSCKERRGMPLSVSEREVEPPAAAADTFDTAADTLLLDGVLADEPLPAAVDEAFDDFVFAFDQSNRLQRERVRFPLLVSEADGETREMPRSQWQHHALFLGQDFCTVLWNSRHQMDQAALLDPMQASVEQIYLHSRQVEAFHFEKDTLSGQWMLTALSRTPFEHCELQAFFDFYRQFATDSIFQREHVRSPLRFVMTFEDAEAGTVEGTIDVDQWFEFAPEMPQDVITNICYGQTYPNPDRIVMQMRGFSNSLQNLFSFHRDGSGTWKLTAYEN